MEFKKFNYSAVADILKNPHLINKNISVLYSRLPGRVYNASGKHHGIRLIFLVNLFGEVMPPHHHDAEVPATSGYIATQSFVSQKIKKFSESAFLIFPFG